MAAPRTLGPLGVASIVVGGIVGVGIFFTPATLAREVPSPGWVIALWVVGGLLSALGALILAELGTLVPEEGGIYAFVREGFGPALAFLYGWINLLVVQPGAIAVIALVLAMNVRFVVGELPPGVETTIAMGAVALFTGINALGLRTGSGVQIAITAVKLLAVAVLVGLGVVYGDPASLGGGESAPLSVWPALVAAGLIPVLFTYAGWQHGSYVAGVVREPGRSLPLGIGAGIAVVVITYISVNLGYLALLGQDGMASSEALAADAARVALGDTAGDALAIVVIVSAAGILATILLAFPRVIYAMGRDGVFFAAAGRLHPRLGTPVLAITATGGWAMLGTLLGSERIDMLIAGLAFGEWAFLASLGVALVRLRRGRGGFRVPTMLVVLFTVVAAAIALGALVVKPLESAYGLGIAVVGLVVYAVRRHR